MGRLTWLAAVSMVALGLVSAPASASDVCPDDPGLRINEEGASPGYMLLAPYEQAYAYLVDIDGHVVKKWRTSTRPGNAQQLTTKGELVRAGNLELDGTFSSGQGAGGRLEALSWDGETLWQHDFADDTQMQHHQIHVMPNGHVLVILWERIEGPEVLAAGRDPELLPDNELWPDKVVEYDPRTDEVVWEWRLWDHIVQDRDPSKPNYVEDVSTRPDRIDLNYVLPEDNPGQEDWAHVNAVNYNPERDEIVISPRSFNELWVIDHATTTRQARGPAGDLKFRFGNPRAHGDDGERTFFAQHDTAWIEPGLPGEGNIILFNNGVRERAFSSVDEVVPKLDAEGNYVRDPDGGFAAEIKRVYPKRRADDAGDFSAIVSSAQRLPNGNTLIGYGTHGRVLEVTPEGAVVWEYENPYCARRPGSTRSTKAGFPVSGNWFFQVDRYSPEFPGFAGHEEALEN